MESSELIIYNESNAQDSFGGEKVNKNVYTLRLNCSLVKKQPVIQIQDFMKIICKLNECNSLGVKEDFE